ncbi:MAG: EhaD family protein [Methanocalculaceae archaeon]|jgi:energy-converting hydrogenase A subunit D|nr:EhaD family protein [Methanocalculaceae archaeon]
MIELFAVLAALLALIGGIATVAVKNPFDKLITLGILVSGAVIFMVSRGYLDVAIVVSLMMPVGTLFILLLCRKKPEGLQ